MKKKKTFAYLGTHDIGKTTVAQQAIKCGLSNVVESVCDCEKHLSLFPNGQYRCTKCWEWWYR
jgi:hypothetical protein